MKAYKNKRGDARFMQTIKTLTNAVQDDNSTGFCIGCGNEQMGVEPDMRKGHCDDCGAELVYGAEELMMMGLCY